MVYSSNQRKVYISADIWPDCDSFRELAQIPEIKLWDLVELGLHPDRQTVRPLRDCLVSTNFARDCLVTKNVAPSLRKTDSPKHPIATNQQIMQPWRGLARWWSCGYSFALLHFRFRSGVLWEYSFAHGTVFPWGHKPTYCAIAMLPACD